MTPPIEVLPYIPPRIAIDTLDDHALQAGARNVCESGRPRAGYPTLIPGYPNTRLFMNTEDIAAATSGEEVYELSNGTFTKIYRIELPPGHDTASLSRTEFLSNQQNVTNLLYPPVLDLKTGSNEHVDAETFQRWLDMGFRIFDQHDRVIPGTYGRVVQLLGLRNAGKHGRQLGMPVGNGTFSSPGPHPASNPFILMPLPHTNGDMATLVWGHPSDEQSHEVWVPPGGFGNRLDIVDGRYSSWRTAARLCLAKTGLDISSFSHELVHREFALSSPTTINSILVPESHLVEVPYTAEFARQVQREIPTGVDVVGSQWFSVRALIHHNTELRRAGAHPDFDHKTKPDHVYWDTHMRGFLQAIRRFRRRQAANN